MAEVKIQKIYEKTLSILGKTEEGTDYPFMDRFPAILNGYISELNIFRSANEQIDLVSKINDVIDITAKEEIALAYCMAVFVSSEVAIPDVKFKLIFETRNRLMSSFNTGFMDLPERFGM